MLYALSQLMLLKEKSSRKLFLFQGFYAPNTDQIKCDDWGVIWKKAAMFMAGQPTPPGPRTPPRNSRPY